MAKIDQNFCLTREDALAAARADLATRAFDGTEPPDFSRGPVGQLGVHLGRDATHGSGVTVPWGVVAAEESNGWECAGWVTVYADGHVA